MQVDNIITLSRTLTHTDSDQISDSQALDYLNIVYKKIASEIVMKIDEDYFWDIFETDTVANQNEYVLPLANNLTAWFKKITRVELKYSATDSARTLVSSDTIANYKDTVDRLDNDISTANAFYDIKDGSIFIYPAPKQAVTDWLVINAITTLVDLVSWGSESSIYPNNSELREYHDVLAVWMKQYIFSQQWLINEKNDAINEYRLVLDQLLDTLKDRYFNAVETELPSSYFLRV